MATPPTIGSDGAQSASHGEGGELARDARKLKDGAKNRARQEAEKRKGEATNVARATSSALDKAAADLKQDKDAPDWLASAFEKTASSIDRYARSVDRRSSDQIGRDVSRFARENPTAFLAASAAAGFAASRFLRAGAEYQHDHQGGGENLEDASSYSPPRESSFSGAEGGTVL